MAQAWEELCDRIDIDARFQKVGTGLTVDRSNGRVPRIAGSKFMNFLLQMLVNIYLSVIMIRRTTGRLTKMQMKQQHVTISCLGMRAILMKQMRTRNSLTL